MRTLTPFKIPLTLAAVALITAVAGCGSASEVQSVPASSQVIDVRTPREFAAWHFPGAVNIPVGDLERRLHQLDAKKEIIVYCRSGSRSAVAKQILLANGFTSVKNGGGLGDMKRFVDHRRTSAKK